MSKISIKPRLFLIISVLVTIVYGVQLQGVTDCKIVSRFTINNLSTVNPDDFQANIQAKYGIAIKPISNVVRNVTLVNLKASTLSSISQYRIQIDFSENLALDLKKAIEISNAELVSFYDLNISDSTVNCYQGPKVTEIYLLFGTILIVLISFGIRVGCENTRK
jgi:hypothetical protein